MNDSDNRIAYIKLLSKLSDYVGQTTIITIDGQSVHGRFAGIDSTSENIIV